MKLFVGRDGLVRHLLDEDSPVEKVLPPPRDIARFSNVQTAPGTADWYVTDLPDAPPAGPFPTRKAALRFEEDLALEYLRRGHRPT